MEQNDETAAANRTAFARAGVFVVNVIGSPGAGKTTLFEHILPKLAASARTAVIEGDLFTDNDARRIEATGVRAIQINTQGGCHLDAAMIGSRLAGLPLDELDILIIENVGNLVCPASFALGEDMRLVVLSLAEGDDKPEKYPKAFLTADAVALTKTDLAPYVRADVGKMKDQITRIRPDAHIFPCSLRENGYDDGGLAEWLFARAREKAK